MKKYIIATMVSAFIAMAICVLSVIFAITNSNVTTRHWCKVKSIGEYEFYDRKRINYFKSTGLKKYFIKFGSNFLVTRNRDVRLVDVPWKSDLHDCLRINATGQINIRSCEYEKNTLYFYVDENIDGAISAKYNIDSGEYTVTDQQTRNIINSL